MASINSLRKDLAIMFYRGSKDHGASHMVKSFQTFCTSGVFTSKDWIVNYMFYKLYREYGKWAKINSTYVDSDDEEEGETKNESKPLYESDLYEEIMATNMSIKNDTKVWNGIMPALPMLMLSPSPSTCSGKCKKCNKDCIYSLYKIGQAGTVLQCSDCQCNIGCMEGFIYEKN